MRAQEFIRRQLREDIEDFPIANVRKANGAIGNQGVNTEQAADVLTHAAGMQVSADMSMRQLVDALKADPAAQQRLRQFVQKNPVTVYALPDGSYHLQDGHHRTFLLNLLGDETVPAVVKEDVTEAKTVEFEGLTLKVIKQDHELTVDALDEWGNKVLGHVKFNIGDGKELDPQDLRVDDRYQGQGIARVMYDYVKSLGYTINRSWDQTDAGAGFWNKHRGEDVRVWEQGVAEGSLNESAVFLNPTTVVVGQAHGQPLELSPDTLKKIQDIAAKHGAWYEGNGTDRSYTKGQIDRYVGSWDDEVAKSASPNDPKWLYVLFANVDENNRVQRVGVDPKDTIFNRLLAGAQDNSFQGIGYTAQALQKFLQMASEGKYDFVKMSQQPATQENLTRFLKAGEALMWPSNWEQYPNRAGKIAKAATVDVRDQYLATRKAGVYVTGSGHLKAVQNITGQQGVAENFADGKNPGRKGLAKRSGVNTKASVSSLRKTAKNSSGEKQRMAHWLANMKAGRAKARRK